MQRARKLLIAGILLVVTYAAHAAVSGTGKVAAGWYTYPGGIVFFYLDGPNNGHTGSPCTVIPTRWAIDTTTLDGKNSFAQLMLAFSQDRIVEINGIDGVGCIHGNTEVASIIKVY